MYSLNIHKTKNAHTHKRFVIVFFFLMKIKKRVGKCEKVRRSLVYKNIVEIVLFGFLSRGVSLHSLIVLGNTRKQMHGFLSIFFKLSRFARAFNCLSIIGCN